MGGNGREREGAWEAKRVGGNRRRGNDSDKRSGRRGQSTDEACNSHLKRAAVGGGEQLHVEHIDLRVAQTGHISIIFDGLVRPSEILRGELHQRMHCRPEALERET